MFGKKKKIIDYLNGIEGMVFDRSVYLAMNLERQGILKISTRERESDTYRNFTDDEIVAKERKNSIELAQSRIFRITNSSRPPMTKLDKELLAMMSEQGKAEYFYLNRPLIPPTKKALEIHEVLLYAFTAGLKAAELYGSGDISFYVDLERKGLGDVQDLIKAAR